MVTSPARQHTETTKALGGLLPCITWHAGHASFSRWGVVEGGAHDCACHDDLSCTVNGPGMLTSPSLLPSLLIFTLSSAQRAGTALGLQQLSWSEIQASIHHSLSGERSSLPSACSCRRKALLHTPPQVPAPGVQTHSLTARPARRAGVAPAAGAGACGGGGLSVAHSSCGVPTGRSAPRGSLVPGSFPRTAAHPRSRCHMSGALMPPSC